MRAPLLLASLALLAACSSTDPSDAGVHLATDGSRFEVGGPITVELSNESAATITYSFCQRFWERRVGLTWERFEEMNICTPALTHLAPGETASESIAVPYGLVPGTYRVSVAVSVGDEAAPTRSNEFVVELGEQR
jgi:hypothetical protein